MQKGRRTSLFAARLHRCGKASSSNSTRKFWWRRRQHRRKSMLAHSTLEEEAQRAVAESNAACYCSCCCHCPKLENMRSLQSERATVRARARAKRCSHVIGLSFAVASCYSSFSERATCSAAATATSAMENCCF